MKHYAYNDSLNVPRSLYYSMDVEKARLSVVVRLFGTSTSIFHSVPENDSSNRRHFRTGRGNFRDSINFSRTKDFYGSFLFGNSNT